MQKQIATTKSQNHLLASGYLLKTKSGFTLIEVLITMGIIILLATLGLFVAADQYKSYALSSDRNTVVSMLQKARNRSMNNINESEHGFTIDSNSNYVLFQTPANMGYSGRNVNYDEIVPRSPAVTVTGLPSSEVIFKQLSGNTSAMTLTLQNDTNALTITVNATGQIDW